MSVLLSCLPASFAIADRIQILYDIFMAVLNLSVLSHNKKAEE